MGAYDLARGTIRDTTVAVPTRQGASLKERYGAPKLPGKAGKRPHKQWTAAERSQEMQEVWGRSQPGPGRRGGWYRKPAWPYWTGVAQSLTAAAKDVYDVLLMAASRRGSPERHLAPGECDPTIPTLAVWTRLHRTTVMTAIEALRTRTMIRVRKVPGRRGYPRNVYTIVYEEP